MCSCLIVSYRQKLKAHNFENMQLIMLSLINVEISKLISLHYYYRRFHSSITSDQKWLRERSHESYAKNYSMVFPHDEPLAGRNMRRDPFHKVQYRNNFFGEWEILVLCHADWSNTITCPIIDQKCCTLNLYINFIYYFHVTKL